MGNPDVVCTEVVDFRTGRSRVNMWEKDLSVPGVEWSGQRKLSWSTV